MLSGKVLYLGSLFPNRNKNSFSPKVVTKWGVVYLLPGSHNSSKYCISAFFFLTRSWTTPNVSFSLSSSPLPRDHNLPSLCYTCSSITKTLWPITHRKPQCVSLSALRDSGTHLPHCFRRRYFLFVSDSSLLKLAE